jgi:hypothetical protein
MARRSLLMQLGVRHGNQRSIPRGNQRHHLLVSISGLKDDHEGIIRAASRHPRHEDRNTADPLTSARPRVSRASAEGLFVHVVLACVGFYNRNLC